MVKKRQADLDIGTLTARNRDSIRPSHNKGNKIARSTRKNDQFEFTTAARGFMFGDRRRKSKPQEEQARPVVSSQDEDKPFDLLTARRLSRITKSQSKADPTSAQSTPIEQGGPGRRRTRSCGSTHSEEHTVPSTKLHTAVDPLHVHKTYRENTTASKSSVGDKRTPGKKPVSRKSGYDKCSEQIAVLDDDTVKSSPPSTVSRRRSKATFNPPEALNSPMAIKRKSTSTSPGTSIQNTLKSLASPSNNSSLMRRVHESAAAPSQSPDHVQNYWSTGNKSWIVAFTTRVEICGMFRVTVISQHTGCVNIHGQDVNFPTVQDVYAPTGYRHGVIDHKLEEFSLQQCELVSLNEIHSSICSDIDINLYTQVKACLADHPQCVVIWLEEICAERLEVCIDSILPSQKVPEDYIKLSPRLFMSDCEIASAYGQTTLDTVDYLVKQADIMNRSGTEQLRLVVVGDKDMGKSTLIRYITNKLISGLDEVIHLECDPGQSEFSPPGCLTLHTVRQTLQGPAWCHVPQTVDHMELYGAMSGEVNPDHYMQCLKRLANKCESTSAPLIVNTMGWTQGLGLHYLAATIAAVNPTHVIQLSSESNPYKNFTELTYFSLASYNMFIPAEDVTTLHTYLRYELIPLYVNHISNPRYDDKLKPVVSRDLMSTAYMCKQDNKYDRHSRDSGVSRQVLYSSRAVHSITPYKIDMCNVAIHMNTADSLPLDLILKSINMQLVALCHAPQDKLSTSPHVHFLKLKDSSQLDMVGYGLVRAIDRDNKLLYITTSEPISRLAYVNVLYKLHGTITPDRWMFNQLSQIQQCFLGIRLDLDFPLQ